MALYADTGTFITSSTGVSNAEHINLNATAAQPYVLQVYGYADALNWKYDLAIAAPADNIAPTVSSDEFNFETAPHQLRFTFSEDVSASLSTADLVVSDLTHGRTIPTASMNLDYDFGSNTAVFTFPGFANGVLPDARYTAVIPAGSVQDSSGNPLQADHSFNFFFLRGDANHDARVSVNDFSILASNFGQFNRTFSQADFNYDGRVNVNDFAILASRFGTAFALDGSLQRTGESVGSVRTPFADMLIRSSRDDDGALVA